MLLEHREFLTEMTQHYQVPAREHHMVSVRRASALASAVTVSTQQPVKRHRAYVEQNVIWKDVRATPRHTTGAPHDARGSGFPNRQDHGTRNQAEAHAT